MDLTYEEYVNFVNHLFVQEMLDFEYKFNNTGSTADSLTIL